MRTLAALALLLTLAGCAGTYFTWEDTEKVRDGMTESEVVAILGRPYARAQTGNVTVLTYSFATGFGGAKAVSYRLRDGRVFGTATVGK